MKFPDFTFERKRWLKKYKFVCGIDEVGRGCFAGPVFAAAVVFDKSKIGIMNNELRIRNIKINDSKKLTSKQREKASVWIKKNALSWGVGSASVSQINKVGIKKATEVAFREAISEVQKILVRPAVVRYQDTTILSKDSSLNISISEYPSIFLLIDAFYVPYVRGLNMPRKNARTSPALQDLRARQLAIIKGDSKVISIAAASILAKVERDKHMTTLSKNPNYKKYGWEENKGYGTLKHRSAIKKYGITKLHRIKFVETFLNKLETQRSNVKSAS